MSKYEPAFPIDQIRTDSGFKNGSKGMSKREYFVAAALTGMCANPYYNGKDIAKEAKDLADRLLDQVL